MIHKKAKLIQLLPVVIVLVITIMTGCAVKKNIWGDPETGLILTYRIPENQVIQYQTSSEEIQKLVIMGQTQETKSKASSKFSAKSKGLKEKNLILGITLDAMKIDVSSMQGKHSPDLSSIFGKSFDMTLSPVGKELDLSGAESIQYSLGPSGKQNLKSKFQIIFPDLADKPLKIGDTWATKDDFIEKTGGFKIHLILENTSKLLGLETINGFECVKIETKQTGTYKGEGNQMGFDVKFKGDIKGSFTWYFAYKKGTFVKLNSSSTSKGNVVVTAQNMTIPMTMESKSEIKLIK